MDIELERQKCLKRILETSSQKKIIIAGPGTGKTYTFGQILKYQGGETNIAMTFIRRLVEDMSDELSGLADVHTFHKYCKKTLRSKLGSYELLSYLEKLIESDAAILGLGYKGFSKKFQLLHTECKEIEFYLKRGNYYSAISFDDCVYRLLECAYKDSKILPEFGLLVLDEFQDFNRLEVALIDLLETRGNILIVGDDDQSVYDTLRSASPDYLRKKYDSGEYVAFELPYCSRCTEVIVKAVGSLISSATKYGLLKNRVDKPFRCYLPDKQIDSEKYPDIVSIRCTTLSVVGKYITKVIENIPESDVGESNKPGNEYNTALVIGPHYCLREVAKTINKKFRRLTYSPYKEDSVLIEDAFDLLNNDEESNLGWRIALECCNHNQNLRTIIANTMNGDRLFDSLTEDYVDYIRKALEIVDKIKRKIEPDPFEDQYLRDILKTDYDRVIFHFTPKEEVTISDYDVSEPAICLTTYVGSKGLSAGHVFILGMNEGDLPMNNDDVSNAEVSRFLVGLTRTRKQCHLISNKWVNTPYDEQKRYIQPKSRSRLIDWISNDLLMDYGDVKAADIKPLLK